VARATSAREIRPGTGEAMALVNFGFIVW